MTIAERLAVDARRRCCCALVDLDHLTVNRGEEIEDSRLKVEL